MKRLDLGQTISILANVGVIAGIVFLGIELRQNNELMEEEAQRARAESLRQSLVMMAENGELAAMYLKDREGAELSDVEKHRLGSWMLRGVVGYQTSFQQLPREALESWATGFRREFEASPTFREAWQRYKVTLDPLFVQYMEENVTGGR